LENDPRQAALLRLLGALLRESIVVRSAWSVVIQNDHPAGPGLSETQLESLVQAGYVRVVARPGEGAELPGREAGSGASAARLVLTEDGLRVAGQILIGLADELPGSPPTEAIPRWLSEVGELRWGGVVVKSVRNDAHNQRVVLDAFEEEGWPQRIDDPLPPRINIDAKTRLRETVAALNKGQKPPRIRFRGDGTGQGIRWEAVASRSLDKTITPPSAEVQTGEGGYDS
jgi:hypothetical protein